MTNLKQNLFEKALHIACQEAASLGYNPTEFKKMLDNLGGVKAAIKLVTSGDFQTGFKRLAKMDRLDLTIEHTMLLDEFKTLFNREILDVAKWRLDEVKKTKKGV